MPYEAHAVVATDKASRYLQALCGHFQRKVDATWDARAGDVTFPFGRCTMRADGAALHLAVAADSADAFDRVREVVGGHLERFAVHDALRVTWTETPSPVVPPEAVA